MWYTGVGSRDTPFEVYRVMQRLGALFYKKGWILRSGGAGGADEAFHFGVLGARWYDHFGGYEIFLPWQGFNGFTDNPTDGVYDSRLFPNYEKATHIVSEVHPAWDKLKDSVKMLHTRNVYQVLGVTLEHPSKFLICWAEPKGKDAVKGGTNTAYQLARQNKVEIINLYEEESMKRAEAALDNAKKQQQDTSGQKE